MFIFTSFFNVIVSKEFLHTLVWFQVFQTNTNNLLTFVWFQVFLSNTNNLYTVVWFQVFLIQIICMQLYGFKYS